MFQGMQVALMMMMMVEMLELSEIGIACSHMKTGN